MVMLQIGRYQVRSVLTGTFRLDGGAMFGVVPKVLWNKASPGDDENRISLATRTLLITDRAEGRIILADTGCGTKWRPEDAKRFAIEHDGAAVARALKELGAGEDDVTDVVVTHLHFDHNGGITEFTDESRTTTRPVYRKARHWIHRAQWDHAARPTSKDRASYFEIDYKAVADAGLFHFVEGDRPTGPLPEIEWFLSKGHTPYQLLPRITGDGKAVQFTGDAIPTSAHLRPPWVMAYDLYPLTTIAEKESMLRESIEGGLILAFPHDPKFAFVTIEGAVDKPVMKEVSRT